eukprot:49499-Amphidinium_carterae.1
MLAQWAVGLIPCMLHKVDVGYAGGTELVRVGEGGLDMPLMIELMSSALYTFPCSPTHLRAAHQCALR